MSGLAFSDPSVAALVAERAFRRNLLIETSGAYGEVLKLLPPLTIEPALLDQGLQILDASINAVLTHSGQRRK